MVESADIRDQGSLKAWLEEQPRAVAAWDRRARGGAGAAAVVAAGAGGRLGAQT